MIPKVDFQLHSDCLTSQQGNGFCTDSCNVRQLNFDDNDCCFEQISSRDCQECRCELDGSVHQQFQCPLHLIANGVCNDECNTFEFDYDDGDCCLPVIDNSDCVKCLCHLDNILHVVRCQKSSFDSDWIGDSFCDDGCNTKNFDYDGGDCCLEDIKTNVCEECICYGETIPAAQCKVSNIYSGGCNDGCNVPEYEYDGGDCCLETVYQDDCDVCICHLDGEVHEEGM